jgi:hypothetical protein
MEMGIDILKNRRFLNDLCVLCVELLVKMLKRAFVFTHAEAQRTQRK